MTSTLSLMRAVAVPLSDEQTADATRLSASSGSAAATATTASTPSVVVDVGALFTEHAPFLLRVVERLTGYGPHVEDIVQDVFVVAHRRRHELRDAPELRGWLYRVASNRAQRHRRSLFRFFRMRDAVRDEPAAGPARPDDVAIANNADHANAKRIRACVMSLPFALREVFVLHELEGLTTKMVAELVGIPEGTVWSRLSSARKHFREQWTADTAKSGGSR